MSEATTAATFDQLDSLSRDAGDSAVIDALIDSLRTAGNHHKLFDALLLKQKHAMGLPLTRPTSFEDVPKEQQPAFEEAYVAAAREIGEALLEAGNLQEAWVYLKTIREPGKVAEKLEAIDASQLDHGEETEQLINIALNEGANPVKGLEIMLRTHGTCNTVTAMDQVVHQLPEAERSRSAALLVRELYGDLCHSLRHEVQQKIALAPPGENLRELIAGRDWLFNEGNYHIDVSHLSSVVRFARALEPGSPELAQAIELAEYGTHLDSQFQYAGDPPFEDFYTSHQQFLRALADENREDALEYFREKLNAEPDEEDRPMLAFVLMDLLHRIGRTDEAVDIAEKYLSRFDESTGFSFADLCQQAGRLDALKRVARLQEDPVRYTAALLSGQGESR